MPQPAKSDGVDKFRRYRTNQRQKGMRLLRVWVPDPHHPGFHDEARRQAALLRGASEEREALDFIAAIADIDDETAG